MRRFLFRMGFTSLALVVGGCGGAHLPGLRPYARPVELVGNWVDLHSTTVSDTSIWVLRADGYDGIMHVRVTNAPDGATRIEHGESRYGSWYLDGSLSDTAGHGLCFSRRPGRFGATCIAFSLSTDSAGSRHLFLRGYRGEHSTDNRELVARR